jgi:hypothetical protein
MKLRVKERYFPRATKAAVMASVSRTDATGKAHFRSVFLVINVLVIGENGLSL